MRTPARCAQGPPAPQREAPRSPALPRLHPRPCDPKDRFPEPLLVDWKPLDRGDLEVAMQEGLAVVTYNCKTFKLLKHCRTKGSYAFIGMNRKEQVVRIESAEELKANLPAVGATWAASISAELHRDATLEIALVAVGKRSTLRSGITAADLTGDCDGATHYVRGASVGAFAFDRGSKGQVRSVAQLFGTGASGASTSGKWMRDRDGDLNACSTASSKSDAPTDQCGALLRVELATIATTQPTPAAPPECPAGLTLRGGTCAKVEAEAPHTCRADDLADCQRQCDRNDGESCHRLGIAMMGGRGATRDQPKGMGLLRRSCELGVSLGCDHYAWNLLRGAPEVKSETASPPWFQRACDGGVLESCNGLAIVYQYGVGVPRDGQRAASLYQLACDGAEPSACNNLGGMYREGNGVPRDDAKAAAVYTRACGLEIDDGCACSYAGDHYVTGRGVPVDKDRGIDLLKRGCKKGYRYGCERLGQLGLSP